jgi:hypothetical protein
LSKDEIVEIRYRCSRCGIPHPVGMIFVCCPFDDMEGNIAAAESWEPGTGEKIKKTELDRELAGEKNYDPLDAYDGPDEAQEWHDFDPDA